MGTKQFSTFFVENCLYGIDVMVVQEIAKPMPMTEVPLSQKFVHGLINLRGQIATAIGLRELFELHHENAPVETMNVICKGDGLLLSLIVDQIGEVVEVDDKDFERTPDTVTASVGRFMSGVYKTPGHLLSIVDINKVIEVLNK